MPVRTSSRSTYDLGKTAITVPLMGPYIRTSDSRPRTTKARSASAFLPHAHALTTQHATYFSESSWHYWFTPYSPYLTAICDVPARTRVKRIAAQISSCFCFTWNIRGTHTHTHIHKNSTSIYRLIRYFKPNEIPFTTEWNKIYSTSYRMYAQTLSSTHTGTLPETKISFHCHTQKNW